MYRPRLIEAEIQRRLGNKGAILLQGPKWCGKTTTAERFAKSVLFVDAPGKLQQYRQLSALDIGQLLDGEPPRLLDEWQLIPQLWDAVRYEVDHRHAMGQFILTGSATPPDKSEINHSGIGRFARITMRPMSLQESGDSSAQVSLGALFRGEDMVKGRSAVDLRRLSYLICRGGWPLALDMAEDADALQQAIDYADSVALYDISRVNNVERSPDVIRRLLRSYARLQGSQATLQTISTDVNGQGNQSISSKTISVYLNELRQIFVVEDMPAWCPDLRSKSALRLSDTRYFVDPSIATAALGLSPDRLMQDLHTMGSLFETMCIRDIRVYAQHLDGAAYHFLDRNGLECDIVVQLRSGEYGLIEVKLGGDALIESGAASLKQVASKIDISKMGEPSFLMVLVGVGEFAYRRADGVIVVPIGTLGA